MRLKADLLLLLVALMWGSAFVAQRIAGQQSSVHLFNGARYLVAALVVLPFVQRRGPGRFLPAPAQWLWMLTAGTILFVAAGFQQAGMVYTSAGNAGFLTSLYVVFVPIVLLVGWREWPRWPAAVAVLLAAGGAFMLSTGGRYSAQRGDLLELVGGLFWSLHVVLVGKFASRYEHLSFSLGQLVVCGVLSLAYGAFVEPLPIGNLLPWLASVAYTGVFALGIGYTVQVWAQRHTPPTDAALIMSFESVAAALAGWLLLGEVLRPSQLAGGLLILAAIVLSQLKLTRS
jgi:drug/metabolite transporter (DMT)-like permease